MYLSYMVLILMSLTVWLAIWDKENVNCLSRFFYLHKSTMQEFRCQATIRSYCEHHFRVIWPEPVPTHYHLCSKIKMKCPDCNEVSELYDFLSTKYCRLLNPVSRGFVCFS